MENDRLTEGYYLLSKNLDENGRNNWSTKDKCCYVDMVLQMFGCTKT